VLIDSATSESGSKGRGCSTKSGVGISVSVAKDSLVAVAGKVEFVLTEVATLGLSLIAVAGLLQPAMMICTKIRYKKLERRFMFLPLVGFKFVLKELEDYYIL
jgi:hypothetical protein